MWPVNRQDQFKRMLLRAIELIDPVMLERVQEYQSDAEAHFTFAIRSHMTEGDIRRALLDLRDWRFARHDLTSDTSGDNDVYSMFRAVVCRTMNKAPRPPVPHYLASPYWLPQHIGDIVLQSIGLDRKELQSYYDPSRTTETDKLPHSDPTKTAESWTRHSTAYYPPEEQPLGECLEQTCARVDAMPGDREFQLHGYLYENCYKIADSLVIRDDVANNIPPGQIDQMQVRPRFLYSMDMLDSASLGDVLSAHVERQEHNWLRVMAPGALMPYGFQVHRQDWMKQLGYPIIAKKSLPTDPSTINPALTVFNAGSKQPSKAFASDCSAVLDELHRGLITHEQLETRRQRGVPQQRGVVQAQKQLRNHQEDKEKQGENLKKTPWGQSLEPAVRLRLMGVEDEAGREKVRVSLTITDEPSSEPPARIMTQKEWMDLRGFTSNPYWGTPLDFKNGVESSKLHKEVKKLMKNR